MDTATYAAEAAVEESHWWFVNRRRLFARMIRDLQLPRHAEVLDAGTSTGTNLRLLRELGFSNVQGVDISEDAIRFCAEKQLGPVLHGDLCSLPFASAQFDLVLATDVIEHLEDDRQAVSELFRVLKPGGFALITVPAFPSLWGLQDDVAHHKRRYRMHSLRPLLHRAGFNCLHAFHFNFLLFLPIWVARRVISLLRLKLRSENDVNNQLINRLLSWIFRCDIGVAPWLRPPFGVSILLLCSKPVDCAAPVPATRLAG